MKNIFEELDKLIGDFIETLPEDKQKHFLVSKGLYVASDINGEFNDVISPIICMFNAFEIGLKKEILDANYNGPINIESYFDEIFSYLYKMQRFIEKNGLDEKDLIADLTGILTVMLKTMICNIQEKK